MRRRSMWSRGVTSAVQPGSITVVALASRTKAGPRRRSPARREVRSNTGVAWVAPPLPPEAVTVSHDPLRSRARFLAVLTPEQRRAWVKAAKAALDEVERRVLEWDQGVRADVPDRAPVSTMTRSGLLDVAARRTWVGEVDVG